MSLDLSFARVLEAEPEEVFDAFTNPVGQEHFYGQDDPGWIVESQCDLRVGGVWTVAFGPSRSELYRHTHVFQVIERPRRLVLTTTETRLDGWSFDTELEFTFEPQDGKTLMTMVQKGFPSIESTMAQAKEAAGARNILVHGAQTAQSCLQAGVLDELEIHLIPVLLGDGRRLFEHLGARHIELELIRIIDAPGVTHLRYRVDP